MFSIKDEYKEQMLFSILKTGETYKGMAVGTTYKVDKNIIWVLMFVAFFAITSLEYALSTAVIIIIGIIISFLQGRAYIGVSENYLNIANVALYNNKKNISNICIPLSEVKTVIIKENSGGYMLEFSYNEKMNRIEMSKSFVSKHITLQEQGADAIVEGLRNR